MHIEHMDYYTNFGLKVAYYRKKRKYTQEALAAEVGIEPTNLSKIENANVGTSLDVLFSISKVLNVPPHKFFEFKDD